jgi:PAS domain S-box-containing protein
MEAGGDAAAGTSWFATMAGLDDDPPLAMLYRILDAAPIGMAITDERGSLVWANTTLYDLLGFGAEDLLQHPLADRVHSDDRAALAAATDTLLSGGADSFELEERLMNIRGEAMWVLERTSLGFADSVTAKNAVTPKDKEQQRRTARLILHQVLDIRDRRQAEESLEDVRNELADRNGELEQMNTDLARSNADLAEFAYVVSHDLSEPLRVIAGHVQLIEERYSEVLDDDGRRWIDFAVEGCSRLRILIDDLMLYSRAGRSTPMHRSVDLNEVVDRSLAGLQVAIEHSGAIIDVGTLPVVRGDASQLGQLFGNLIGNAIKFHRPDQTPRVSITARPAAADAWEIAVEDNGIGIAVRHRERIFGPFQRLHRREEYVGTGIGLAICRKVVERHGGRIWLEDAPGGGSRFCFTIPIDKKD